MVAVSVAAGAAWAAVRVKSFTAQCQGDHLLASFDVSGLGNQNTANFEVRADAVVDVQCINKAGKEPPGQHFESIGVSGTGTFDVRNGRAIGQVATEDVTVSDVTCPPGFAARRVTVVEFQNVELIYRGEVIATLGKIRCP
jgi:hypothetical protein